MVKIVVDSASDIDDKEAEKRGIVMLPMTINIDGVEYKDGIDLHKEEFFEKLENSTSFPKTSQINEFAFDEAFKKIVDNGDEAVVILISSKLSGTYASAAKAAEKYADKIFVVDSLQACISERILVDYAERLILEGKGAKETSEILNKKKLKIRLFALIDTLKYLRKGGRISSIVALAGGILGIKPVIAIEDGELKMAGKSLGSKKGYEITTKLIKASGEIDYDMPSSFAYSGKDDTPLNKYLDTCKDFFKEKAQTIQRHCIGSTIGTHIGSGSFAFSYFIK